MSRMVLIAVGNVLSGRRNVLSAEQTTDLWAFRMRNSYLCFTGGRPQTQNSCSCRIKQRHGEFWKWLTAPGYQQVYHQKPLDYWMLS